MAVVIEHLSGDVTDNARVGLIAQAAFTKLRDRRMPEIVKAKPLQAGRPGQLPATAQMVLRSAITAAGLTALLLNAVMPRLTCRSLRRK